VLSDSGIALVPTTTYANCPKQLDLLFVPGGDVSAAMVDQAALQFLTERAPQARYVTSVCTGSLVLAAAGLLNGYRAATHWAARDILAMFELELVEERVAIDRNRVTGGGVTAGIDFGLSLVAELLDAQTAKTLQLMLEYTPHPPFDAGDPTAAGAELVAIASAQIEPLNIKITEAAQTALARL
jgi:cyclohexyl-isocyanide hydratase